VIGGIVQSIDRQGDRVHITVGGGSAGLATVSVHWPATTCSIAPGDQLRWANEQAIWTPADMRFTWHLWVVGATGGAE
jgi:hypothetical protein